MINLIHKSLLISRSNAFSTLAFIKINDWRWKRAGTRAALCNCLARAFFHFIDGNHYNFAPLGYVALLPCVAPSLRFHFRKGINSWLTRIEMRYLYLIYFLCQVHQATNHFRSNIHYIRIFWRTLGATVEVLTGLGVGERLHLIGMTHIDVNTIRQRFVHFMTIAND